MRILMFADLHAHNFSQFASTLPGGRNSRLQNTLDVLKEIADYCVAEQIDYVFCLGDVFHSRVKIDVDVYQATWLAFKKISEVVEQMFILVGNHDTYTRDGSRHSLEAFRAFATVIDRPVVEKVTKWLPDGRFSYVVDGGSFTFAAHPFTTDIERWKEFTHIMPKVDFFLFHQGVCEATVGAFDISVKAEVSYHDFPLDRAQLCLGGHYHKHQWLGGQGRVAFVGSPLQHNFGERADGIKGWMVIDTTEGEDVQVESTAPRFFLFDSYEDFCGSNLTAAQIEENYVRVKCTTEQAQNLHPAIQAELTAPAVYVEKRIDESVIGDDRELLKTYVEQTDSDLDRDRLVALGMELLVGGEE